MVPLVLNCAYLLTAVNAMSVKYDQITNPESLLVFSTAIKCICWHSWAFLPTEMTVFTTLSYTSKQVKSLPFHISEA